MGSPRAPWDPSSDPWDHKILSLGPRGSQSSLKPTAGIPRLRKSKKQKEGFFSDFALPRYPKKETPEAPQGPLWDPQGGP